MRENKNEPEKKKEGNEKKKTKISTRMLTSHRKIMIKNCGKEIYEQKEKEWDESEKEK